MSVDEIIRRLERLDAALRVVESEGRDLEEKIRKGTGVMFSLTDASFFATCFVRSFVIAGSGPAYSEPQRTDYIALQCTCPGRGGELVGVCDVT